MIGVITVKVSAAKPSFPISTVPVFVGSDCTLAVGDVPSVFYGVRLTSVSVSITNADGATVTAVCVRSGVTWCATIPGAHFRVPGRVRAGLTVSACGTHEDGTTIGGWTLGRGDVEIMPADAVPAPGVAWQDVHLRDDEPEVPVKGDLAKVGGSWKIYTGAAWDPIGGGGGAVESVNGKMGAVKLVAADVGALALGSSNKVGSLFSMNFEGEETSGGNLSFGVGMGPGGWTFVVNKFYCSGVSSLYANGLVITNTSNEEGASVLARIQEYGGDFKTALDEVNGLIGTALDATAAYPMSTVVDGALKDRTVNHATAGGTFTFPERTGTNARDFVIVIDALETAPTVTFPGSYTYVSEQDAADIWTAEAGKVNAWYFSEVADGVFMVCHKAMSVVAQ